MMEGGKAHPTQLLARELVPIVQCWRDGETLALRLEQLEDSQLEQVFCDPKYGIQYRNFHGLIEHAHYHLGQISILKSLQQAAKTDH